MVRPKAHFNVSLTAFLTRWLAMVGLAMLVGCDGQDTTKTSLFDHEHEVPAHAPRSLWDLGQKIRERIAQLEKFPSNHDDIAELNDLIGWSAEVAADTNIGEERWMPIYELSEVLRRSIEDDALLWDTTRCNQAIRLCQLTEDAWRSLAADERVERYLGHSHSHDHSVVWGEHDQGEHGHSHSEDAGHAHSPGSQTHHHSDDDGHSRSELRGEP